MDLNKIKERLEALQPKPKQKYEKIDRTKFFWKPSPGVKSTIRIVPFKENPKELGKPVYVHYNIHKTPMLALTNYNEADPIVEFSDKLKKTNDKDSWKQGAELAPKMRFFIPIVVRGEEEKGTRLWEVGKKIYTELLKIASDGEYGDFTDPQNGFDFKVEVMDKNSTGKTYNETTIRIARKESVLTEDKNLLNEILNNQPNILTIYPKQNYDDMKKILQEYLTPSEDEVEENSEEEAEAVDANGTVLAKKSKSESFEDIFNK